MRQYITADDILAELLMVRTQFKGTLLILEGPTDCLFFDGLIDASQCKTIPGYGKERVVGVIEQVDKRQLPGILGIVDADFWHLEEISISSPNLLVTDLHDLEMMLIESRAFDKVIAQCGSAQKVTSYMA